MPDIELAREGDLAIVTINRPEKRNAMTYGMWRGLAEAMHGLKDTRDIRSVILTGAGGNFCAGADIAEFGEVRSNPAQGKAYAEAVDGACDAIIHLNKPVIAAVEGNAFGGGCGLAIACDFRIAARGARFSIPAAKLSIVYSLRETQMLLALVGLPNAKRILCAAEAFDAEAARALGLVDEIAPGHAMAAAKALAEKFSDKAPISLAGHKQVLNGLALGLGALEERTVHALTEQSLASEDYAEGRRAFLEKRKPRFTGR